MSHLAWITGSGRGIGASIAEHFATNGVAVIVSARTKQDCEHVADSIRNAGGTATPVALDVTNPSSIESAVATVRDLTSDHGPIDWLVNNAGIAVSAPLLGGDDESFQRHLDVNLHGPRRMIEALVPDMVERGYGRVVQIASSAALQGYAYVAAYTASKHALLGYTRSAALELAKKGVTFNLVCPHYVDSPMTQTSIDRVVETTGRSREDAAKFFADQNPGGRLVRPDEVASAAYELCLGEANGQVIELDGRDR